MRMSKVHNQFGYSPQLGISESTANRRFLSIEYGETIKSTGEALRRWRKRSFRLLLPRSTVLSVKLRAMRGWRGAFI